MVDVPLSRSALDPVHALGGLVSDGDDGRPGTGSHRGPRTPAASVEAQHPRAVPAAAGRLRSAGLVAASRAPAGRGFDALGYHPGDYRPPRTPAARFEVIMGAVLTQNTAWTNAAAALTALRRAGVRLPVSLLALPRERLAGLIRSSGYFNQKARKLRSIAAFFSGPECAFGAAAPRGTLCSPSGESARRPPIPSSCTLSRCRCSSWTRTRAGSSARIGLIRGRESLRRHPGSLPRFARATRAAVQRVPRADRGACQGALPDPARVRRVPREPLPPPAIARPILNRRSAFQPH